MRTRSWGPCSEMVVVNDDLSGTSTAKKKKNNSPAIAPAPTKPPSSEIEPLQQTLEERPGENTVELFGKKYLTDLVKEAVAEYPADLVPTVRALANVDPAPRTIWVRFVAFNGGQPCTRDVREMFKKYGEVNELKMDSCSLGKPPTRGSFQIRFERRIAARKALENPRLQVGHTMYTWSLHPTYVEDFTRFHKFRYRIYAKSTRRVSDPANPYGYSGYGGGNIPPVTLPPLPPPQPELEAMESEEMGEEPIENLVQALGMDSMVGLVKLAISKDPNFVQSVHRQADVDPAFHLIVVSAGHLDRWPINNKKLISVFQKFGKILDCTLERNQALILFKDRSSTLKALKPPYPKVGKFQTDCDRYFAHLATPTKVKLGIPLPGFEDDQHYYPRPEFPLPGSESASESETEPEPETMPDMAGGGEQRAGGSGGRKRKSQ